MVLFCDALTNLQTSFFIMANPNLKSIKNSTVLVRVGYDLASLQDTLRIQDSLETIRFLLANQNKVLLLAHWGRPKGQPNPKLSLSRIQAVLQSYLTQKVGFYDQFAKGFDPEAIRLIDSPVILLENTRFDPAEKSKDAQARQQLALKYSSLADFFVDEAFSVSHRKEATNHALKSLMPFTYGFSYQREVETLNSIKSQPKKPLAVIMGGAKLETKLPLIHSFLPVADMVLLAGKLAFTFIRAGQDLGWADFANIDLGSSEINHEFLPTARDLILKYPQKLVLPVDFEYFEDNGTKIGDIGPRSLELFAKQLEQARTVFWNGPLGFYEKKPFDRGTDQLAQKLSQLKNCFKVIGGGDITSAIKPEILDKFDFVSMGGGATLKFLTKS
jgi:phosphoglycerate kinase